MSFFVNIVLNPARYFMIAGLTLLALLNFDKLYTGSLVNPDFESILPEVLSVYVPAGLLGILIAGLFAAFMSNFAATVNAAPAYIVNDIYRRFINPGADDKKSLRVSYAASLLVIGTGITAGMLITSINDTVLWITAALWGGYTAPNILKWYWWRFNAYGYFWGMVSGVGCALVLPLLNLSFLRNWPLQANPSLNSFPVIFLVSLAGCFAGSLLTKPDDAGILKNFYKTVRPWGFWRPVIKMVKTEDPGFEGNGEMKRDLVNVMAGIIWQTALVAFPVFLILREWRSFFISLIIIFLSSLFLKFFWWNRLKD